MTSANGRGPSATAAGNDASGPSVAVIGAGFSGICMGIQLLKAGYRNFVLYEAADDIGGTWRDNSYPGCSCDIPSVQYHFSFEPVIWEEPYVGQPKILQYLHHCVQKYNLQDHIQLNTRISSAAFHADRAQWHITTAEGQESWAQILVLAQGGLAIPSSPKIPGLDSFQGTTFHSAQWNHSYDLTGKRVAIVGTGASAVQIIPCIQPLVEQLYVFQRTPGWVVARADFTQRSKYLSLAFAALGISTAAAAAAAGAGLVKGRTAAAAAAAGVAAAGAAAAAGSGRMRLWVQRQVSFWLNELLLGPAVTKNDPTMIAELTKLALDNLTKSVPDPELRAKLTPSYSIGCKRVLGSDRYYQALQKGNVELIASAVSQVSADGTITAADGSTAADVDAIILATGFDVAASLQFKTLTVKGLDGKDLCKTLAEDPYGTYLGLAVSGFPNMFVLMGPNTWLGHNSVLFMIECGVKLIMKFIKEMKRSTGKLQWWEVDQSAQQRFSREAQARLQGSVWLSGGCSSWYLPKEDGMTSKVTVHAAGHADDLSAADQDTGMSDVTAVPKPSRRADSQQQSCVMWMGTCVEYWWRTLWPRRGDWASVLG